MMTSRMEMDYLGQAVMSSDDSASMALRSLSTHFLISALCLVVRFMETNIISANRWVKLGPIRYHTRPSPSHPY